MSCSREEKKKKSRRCSERERQTRVLHTVAPQCSYHLFFIYFFCPDEVLSGCLFLQTIGANTKYLPNPCLSPVFEGAVAQTGTAAEWQGEHAAHHCMTGLSLARSQRPSLISAGEMFSLWAEEYHDMRLPVIISSRLAGAWPLNCSMKPLPVGGGAAGSYFLCHCLWSSAEYL